MLDPFTARALRNVRADLISLKLGINLINGDVMRERAFGPAVHGYLDAVREGHPDTPVVLISPIYCAIHENTPGPTGTEFDGTRAWCVATGVPGGPGKLTLTWIRQTLADIVALRAKTDPNLHYLDGTKLYGPEDYAVLPLPDELHPAHATHLQMGERFAKWAFEPAGPFCFSTAVR
ncbi:hypothetical protein [Kribbella sandramycini]|uniref:GDSL-like lipase/acylhydrolase family protein n=1 Tax=Kribbella sandramycini TaxID=60450 RepID=A0A841SFH0_9ACTN|nr:hypothetical protein [Kribbella sandramycini]MBB6567712.1 hypothetical protein [Kribbella sandramycini]